MARTPNAAPPKISVEGVTPNGHDTSEDAIVDVVDAPAEGESGPEVEDSADALRAQLAEAERRREEAEARAERLAAERVKDQAVLVDSRLLVIDSTITAKEGEKAAIMQRLREAKEAGDYDAEIKATDELQTINLDLKQAKLGKSQLETQIEDQKSAPTQQDKAAMREQWFEQNNIAPKSREWLRNHTEYLEDPEKNAELTLAHTRAIKAGHRPNSDGYFEAIETELGMRGEAEAEELYELPAPARAPQQRQAAAPAAPVSRTAGPGGGAREIYPGVWQTGKDSYKVTKEVADFAQMSGLTIEEYIKNAKGMKRGSDGQMH